MTTHVSLLVLDELASELPISVEAKAHVDTCPECSARLVTLQAARKASASSFAAHRTRARLLAQPKPSRLGVIGIALAFVACALFLVFAFEREPSEADRLKGAASIQLVDEAGQRVASARVGAHVKMRVGAAGFTHALVVAIDRDGAIAQLWPEGSASDLLPGTGVVTLPRDLEVTPGSVVVEVLLSNAVIDAKQAETDIQSARRAAGATALTRLEVLP